MALNFNVAQNTNVKPTYDYKHGMSMQNTVNNALVNRAGSNVQPTQQLTNTNGFGRTY